MKARKKKENKGDKFEKDKVRKKGKKERIDEKERQTKEGSTM